MYSREPKEVGDRVITTFLRGMVLQVVNGKNQGWMDEIYYLVKPGTLYKEYNLPPHWIRHSELCEAESRYPDEDPL